MEKYLKKRIFKLLIFIGPLNSHNSKQLFSTQDEEKEHSSRCLSIVYNTDNIQHKMLFSADQTSADYLKYKTAWQDLTLALTESYYLATQISALHDYAYAICCKYQTGQTQFDEKIKVAEKELLEYVVTNFSSESLSGSFQERMEMRMILTSLLIYSDFEFSSQMQYCMELLLDILQEKTIKL